MKLIENLGPAVYGPKPHFWQIVILETACFPNKYYAGPAYNNGEWVVYSNATCYYHETLGEAEDAALKMV